MASVVDKMLGISKKEEEEKKKKLPLLTKNADLLTTNSVREEPAAAAKQTVSANGAKIDQLLGKSTKPLANATDLQASTPAAATNTTKTVSNILSGSKGTATKEQLQKVAETVKPAETTVKSNKTVSDILSGNKGTIQKEQMGQVVSNIADSSIKKLAEDIDLSSVAKKGLKVDAFKQDEYLSSRPKDYEDYKPEYDEALFDQLYGKGQYRTLKNLFTKPEQDEALSAYMDRTWDRLDSMKPEEKAYEKLPSVRELYELAPNQIKPEIGSVLLNADIARQYNLETAGQTRRELPSLRAAEEQRLASAKEVIDLYNRDKNKVWDELIQSPIIQIKGEIWDGMLEKPVDYEDDQTNYDRWTYDAYKGHGEYDRIMRSGNQQQIAQLQKDLNEIWTEIDSGRLKQAYETQERLKGMESDVEAAKAQQRYAERQLASIGRQEEQANSLDWLIAKAKYESNGGANAKYVPEYDRANPGAMGSMNDYERGVQTDDVYRIYSFIGGGKEKEYWDSISNGGISSEYHYSMMMTPEEEEYFMTLYNDDVSQGKYPTRAQEFLNSPTFQMELHQRYAQFNELQTVMASDQHPVLASLATIPMSIASTWTAIPRTIAGWLGDESVKDENSPWYAATKQADTILGNVESDIGGIGGKTYRAIMNSANNIVRGLTSPGFGTSKAVQTVTGLAGFFLQVYQDETARNVGKYGYEEAQKIGLIDAAFETAEEFLPYEAMLGSAGKNLGLAIIQNALAETGQEFTGATVGEKLKGILTGDSEQERADEIFVKGEYVDSNGNTVKLKGADDETKLQEARLQAAREFWTNAVESGLGGTLGGGFGAAYGTAETAILNRQANTSFGERVIGKDAEETKANILQLVDAASKMAEDTESAKTAKDVLSKVEKGKTVSKAQLGKLVRSIFGETDEQIGNMAANVLETRIAEELAEEGEQDAWKMAEIVTKSVTGQDLSMEEKFALYKSETARQIRDIYKGGAGVGVVAEQLNATKDLRSIQEDVLNIINPQSSQAAVSEAAAKLMAGAEAASENEIRQAEAAGVKRSGDSAEVIKDGILAKITGTEIRSEKNEDGKTVPRLYVKLNTGDTVDVRDVKAVGAKTAGVLQYLNLTGAQGTGARVSQILIENAESAESAEALVSDAMRLRIRTIIGQSGGRTTLKTDIADKIKVASLEDFAEAEKERVKGGKAITPGKGKVTFNGTAYGSNAFREAIKGLSKTEREEAEAIGAIGKAAGLDVTIIRDANDTKAQGSYSAAQGIVVNLAGEYNKEGEHRSALATFAHEITHQLEGNSLEAYARLRSFVLDNLQAEGVNVEKRLTDIMDNYRANGVDLDVNGALAEIVAKGSEQVLGQENVVETLRKEDPGLLRDIQNVVRGLVDKIRTAMGLVKETSSFESKILSQRVNELSRMWLGAYEEAKQATGTEGTVRAPQASFREDPVKRYLYSNAQNQIMLNDMEKSKVLRRYGISEQAAGVLGEDQLESFKAIMSKKDIKTLERIAKDNRHWEEMELSYDEMNEDSPDYQYVKAWKEFRYDDMEKMVAEKMDSQGGINPVRYATTYTSARDRQIAQLIKEGNPEAIGIAAAKMAPEVPKNAVLIPMPNHYGEVNEDTDTMLLAKALSEQTGRPVVNALAWVPHESRRESKMKHSKAKQVHAEDMGFRQVAEIPEGTIPYFVDNLVASGETARAAHEAFGGKGVTIAYAKSTLSASDNMKYGGPTYYDKKHMFLIPLHDRFDMSRTYETEGLEALKYSQQEDDSAYMDAVERGDMETAQRMVDERAQEAGYNVKVYHGTSNGGRFNVFDPKKLNNSKLSSQIGQGFYFTNSMAGAKEYTRQHDIYGKSKAGTNPYLFEGYLKIQNPIEITENSRNLTYDEIRNIVADGDNDWFFNSGIAHDLQGENINGQQYTKDQISQMSKDEKIDLYVNYLMKYGDKYALQHMVDAYSYDNQGLLLDAVKKYTGKDGIHWHMKEGLDQFVAFDSSQFKDASPVTYDDDGNVVPLSKRFNKRNNDIRYSFQENNSEEQHRKQTININAALKNPEKYNSYFTYENLIKKEPIKAIHLDKPGTSMDRSEVIKQGLENARKNGRKKDGSIYVRVYDIGTEIKVDENSIRHNLSRIDDIRPIVERIGEMLKESVLVNTADPRTKNGKGHYKLLGAAIDNSGNHIYYALFSVNKYTNELETIDKLYAIKPGRVEIDNKKEAADISSSNLAIKDGVKLTASYITIADALNDVKIKFGDVLPKDVMEHFGMQRLPSKDGGRLQHSFQETGTEYMAAAENGDMETAQRLVDEYAAGKGYNIRAFHGTGRADRVGTVFRADRATSGPMAFFTDDRGIAENYSRNKVDTSIAYDEEYEDYKNQFRYTLKDGSTIPVGKLWNRLSFADRQKITEAAKHVTLDDEAEEIIYDENVQYGIGNFNDYERKLNGWNSIDTLIDGWLNGGTLFGREGDFIKVLELVGIKGVKWNNPDARDEKVYDTYLKIENPFDVNTMYTNDFLEALEKWWMMQDHSQYERETANADAWDKNSISVDEWVRYGFDDVATGLASNWTRIPDGVTAYLKHLGYDGIKDRGGKNGGRGHTVWIPFSSEQIKSAEPVTYDNNGNIIPLEERFNPEKEDIRYSFMDETDMDVRHWMMGVPESSLRTEAERQLLKHYKDLRTRLDLREMRKSKLQEEITRLEAIPEGERTTEQEKRLKAVKNRAESTQKIIDETLKELAEANSEEGFATMMYQQTKVMNGQISGRTQAEVTEAVKKLERSAYEIAQRIRKNQEEAQKIADTDVMREVRKALSETSATSAAANLKRAYQSTWTKNEIRNFLDPILLKMSQGEDVSNEVMELAGILVNSDSRNTYEDLEELRGLQIVVSRDQLKEIKAKGSSIKELRSRLAGTGITIKTGDYGTLDAGFSNLLEMYPELRGRGLEEAAENASNIVDAFVDWVDAAKQHSSADEFYDMKLAQAMSDIFREATGAMGRLKNPTKEQTQKILSGMISAVRELNAKTAGLEAEMTEVAKQLDELQQASRSAVTIAKVMENDANIAIDYYNKISKIALDTAKQKRQSAIIEQLKSKHAQQILKNNEQWRQLIERDANARKQAEKNQGTRKKIDTVTRRVYKLLREPKGNKNIPEHMQGLARLVTEMLVDNDLAGRKLTQIDRKSLEEARRVLTEWNKRDGEFNLNDLLAMEDFGDARHVINSDLLAIEEGIRAYNSEIRGKNKVEILEKRGQVLQSIQEAVSEIYQFIQAERTVALRDRQFAVEDEALKVAQGTGGRKFKEWTGKAGRAIAAMHKAIVSGNMTPEYFFRTLGNEGLSELWDEYHNAENRNGLELRRAKERLEEIAKETGYKGWDTQKKMTVHLSSGDVQMSLGQIMSLWATWNREKTLGPDNSQHLLRGGFYTEEQDLREGILGRAEVNKRAHRVTEEDMNMVGDLLTEEQKKYVNDIVAFMSNDMSQLGNEASMKAYGIKMYKEKYYFPFQMWDGIKSRKSNDSGAAAGTQDRAFHPSFSKTRKHGANNALVIGDFTQTAADHIAGMINYATMGLANENLQKVLNYQFTEGMSVLDSTKRNVRAMLEEAYGQEAMQYLAELQRQLNGGAVKTSKSLGDKAISLFRKNAVAGSLSVAAQQPLSYIRAAMMINPKYLARALSPDMWKGSYREMLEHSGVAVIKDMGKFDMNAGQSAREFLMPEGMEKTGRKVWGKVTDAATVLPELMDRMTWTRMWSAVKAEQAEAHPEMDTKSGEFLDLAGERFNELMRRTQVYDSVLVRSQNMRSDNYWVKGLTSFMAEPTLTLNVLADAVRQAKDHEKGGMTAVAKAGATFLLSAALQAAVKGLVGTGRTPDEKKTWEENFLYKFMQNLTSEANPVSLIPGYSDLVTVLKNGKLDDDAMGAIGKIFTAIRTGVDLISGESKNGVYRSLEDSAGQLAQLFTNLPAKNLMRDLRAMYNWIISQPYADRGTSQGVLKYQTADAVLAGDTLTAAVLDMLGSAGWDVKNSAYYERIYNAKAAGQEGRAQDMIDYLLKGRGVSGSSLSEGLTNLAKADRSRSTDEKAAMITGEGDNADSIWWKIDRADFQAETGIDPGSAKYYRLNLAIENNKVEDIREAIRLMEAHGTTKKNIQDKIRDDWRKKYLEASGSEKRKIKDALTKAFKATGMTAEEAIKKIDSWK